MNRWKYVTDLNGEQMPMIIPHPHTPAHEVYTLDQERKMWAERKSADRSGLTDRAIARIHEAIEADARGED